ncbi:MAG: hypothetical protein ABSG15_15465 [FCB group bacterium]
MKTKFLLPNKWKPFGWVVFIISTIIIFIRFILNYNFLEIRITRISIIDMGLSGHFHFFTVLKNENITDILISFLMIFSGLVVAFSKEKIEDEFIRQLRSESLVWAVYVNSILMLICFIVFSGIAIMGVLTFNLFTTLFLFIIRFNIIIFKNKRDALHAK